MRTKKGPGKSASTPLSFCSGNMDYIQVVDVVFLNMVRTMVLKGSQITKHSYGVSQRLQPFLHSDQTRYAFHSWVTARRREILGRGGCRRGFRSGFPPSRLKEPQGVLYLC